MVSKLRWIPFRDINLNDCFFDSLKNDYPGFDSWFKRKADGGIQALTLINNGRIHAFLALKRECEAIELVGKTLPEIQRLKISTLKLDEEIGGQRLGEGLVGVALWYWQRTRFEEVYVTIYEKQEKLIGLLNHFGFSMVGQKHNGEKVLVKSRNKIDYSSAYTAFPFLSPGAQKGGIIPINDEFHDRLFPYSDSAYKKNFVEENTAGNGITKVYIGTPYSATHYSEGEVVAIYRKYTGEGSKGRRSCVTSFCTITKVTVVKNNGRSLVPYSQYLSEAGNKTVFDRNELAQLYQNRNVIMIEMVYNGFFGEKGNIPYIALSQSGLFEKHPYEIDYSMDEMKRIIELGGADVDNIIIN